MSVTAQGISLKIFIGFLLNSELRMHLMHSSSWKEALILQSSDSNAIKIVRYGDKEYWGRYLTSSSIPLNELPALEAELHQALKHHCPQMKQPPSLHLFSQSFIH